MVVDGKVPHLYVWNRVKMYGNQIIIKYQDPSSTPREDEERLKRKRMGREKQTEQEEIPA
ncbi:hypothetical protein ASPTUDRAFT_602186 [Aspergillus tubingensis CBS 134.48]|uniref:Uncharacterized protein n=1 Tax=Aspergillus tubingensis (strain CBS 134.48) TaxID=767770 RepID=A0A1L9N986_ASPTC|nr:hypothetical protein ASPTUDRAFT_602186 [Aspergillus tubingensis CBS 134.48]